MAISNSLINKTQFETWLLPFDRVFENKAIRKRFTPFDDFWIYKIV